MKRILMACALVLAVGLVANAQDTTSLLASFLIQLRNGTFSLVNGTSTSLAAPSDGVLTITNNAGTGLTRINLGPATASFPALVPSGTSIQTSLADGTAGGSFQGNLNYAGNTLKAFGSHLLASVTAPTVSSGFGSSPTIPNHNGTAVFTVNVGTGGTASAGVLALPTANAGWGCDVINLTALAASRASQSTTAGLTYQTATSTTTATLTNVNLGTGGAVAWAASDVLQVKCAAY